jgi:hypothetical protein
VEYFGSIPTFWRNIMPPSSGLEDGCSMFFQNVGKPPSSNPGDESSMFLRNVGKKPKYYTTQQQTRPPQKEVYFLFALCSVSTQEYI